MKAVIMAGGLGTRLRPLTCDIPKPMVPVMNRPLLEHTISLLKNHGCYDIIILLYYLSHKISDHFGDGSKFGVDITYMDAQEDFGTSGAVRQAAPLLSEPFFVLSGDAVTNIDLTNLRDYHAEKRGLATIALSSVPNPSPFGIALTDSTGRIGRFLEKPSWGQVFSDKVNMGIYVFQPEIIEHIPEKGGSLFARDIFPDLLRQNVPMYGFIDDCYWQDIGDLMTYQQVHWDALNGKLNLEHAGKSEKAFSNVIIGDGSQVAPEAELENCIIGQDCKISRHVSLKNVILWDKVQIGQGCDLSACVVGNGVAVGDGSVIEEQAFISDRVQVGSGSHINANIKIWPDKTIETGSVVNSSLVWADRWRRDIFTDSRVTGIANFEMTPEFSAKLGAAYGGWLGKGSRVLLSRDTCHGARMIYRALITGLMSAGIEVSTLQVMPTPIVRYIMRTAPEKGALHIRRSSSDPKLLDIHFFDNYGRDYTQAAAKAIERIFFREDFPRVGIDDIGRIAYPVRAVDSYVQHFIEHVDTEIVNKAKFKFVVDYSFGAAIQVFPSILSALDCEVLALNAHPDPRKFHQTPRDKAHALKQLAKVVQSTHAAAGFWFDAGAERLCVVDNHGRVLSDARLAVLLSKMIMDISPGIKLAAPVSVPSQVEQFAAEKGCTLVHTALDGSAITKSTEDTEVRFALDARGGFIFSDFHFAFDAMHTLAKILQCLARAGAELSALNDEIPHRAFCSAVIACPWESKGQLMRRAMEFSEGKPRLLFDGVKLLFDDAWVLILPDREKAQCCIKVEAGNEDNAQSLIAQYETIVQGWVASRDS